MTEKSKKLKKGIITEQDISILLQRYAANTVLALLQEVAQLEGGVKIDWNALVKKSSTGISSAREYQMLWRHLAYRHSLLEHFDNGAQPLDDDSDLEYELEAFPDVSSEASAEASACVKVLIASGITSDPSHTNNVMIEAPLTINIPNRELVKATSENSQTPNMRGMNITVPVSVQKQLLPGIASAEAWDTNGSLNGTIPPKRKRKAWSEAEDLELLAAVQKYGEGNWAHILRSESTWDRTASQLSQRWGVIRRKVGIGNLNLGTTTTMSTGGVQLSEAQRAARIAMNLALDLPVKNTFIKSGEGTSSSSSQRCFGTKASSSASSSKMQLSTSSSVGKCEITAAGGKGDLSSDPVRAAAVAAGARIATHSDAAASLLRAAQSKNAIIHIMPTSTTTSTTVTKQGLLRPPASEKASSQSTAHHNPISRNLGSTTRANTELPLKQGLAPPLEKASSQNTTQDHPMNVVEANTEIPSKQDVPNGGIKSVANVQVQEHRVSVAAGKEPRKQETKPINTQESVGERLKMEVGEGSDEEEGKMECGGEDVDKKKETGGDS